MRRTRKSPFSPGFQYSLRIVGFRDSHDAGKWPDSLHFQYSLRIVGFRDYLHVLRYTRVFSDFQYSLRIVGFRDKIAHHAPHIAITHLSVFPANRGVPRRIMYSLILPLSPLSVFPANRGVPRRVWYMTSGQDIRLSVFPANRGVPRLPCVNE